MGYEIRMRVGTLFEGPRQGTVERWRFLPDAVVELGKVRGSYVGQLCDNSHNTDARKRWEWYTGEGNKTTATDSWGTQFSPVPLKRVLKALRQDIKTDEWVRFRWALGLLEAMNKTNRGKHDFVVLFEGH